AKDKKFHEKPSLFIDRKIRVFHLVPVEGNDVASFPFRKVYKPRQIVRQRIHGAYQKQDPAIFRFFVDTDAFVYQIPFRTAIRALIQELTGSFRHMGRRKAQIRSFCHIFFLLYVPNGCTKWMYQMDVPNGCTKWMYQMDVPN